MEKEIEIWKPVPYYEGLYEVSNLGRVKTLPRYHRYGLKEEKILKPGYGKFGYAHVALTKNGIMKTTRVHRIVALVFVPNPYMYEFVNHLDGVKSNNAASNLEWCNRSQNMKHAYDLGLMNIETRSKVTMNIADEIRSRGKWGTYDEIGDQYGIVGSTVWNILNNKTWRK